jgi:hypothetical protein
VPTGSDSPPPLNDALGAIPSTSRLANGAYGAVRRNSTVAWSTARTDSSIANRCRMGERRAGASIVR